MSSSLQAGLRSRIPILGFLLIWLGYCAVIGLFNFRSAHDNLAAALLWQFAFVALVAAPVLLFSVGGRDGAPAPSRLSLDWIVGLSLGLSAIAICSLAFDKWRIGIDYSDGVCYARYQMTRLGLERTGVSSAFSVFGNLFGSAFFVAAAAVITQPTSRRKTYIVLALAFLCLIALSTIAATRTIIMLFTAMCVACACLRYASAVPLPRLKWFDFALPLVMLAGAIYFVIADFNCRAEASNLSATEYMQDFAPVLGAEVASSGESTAAATEKATAVASDSGATDDGASPTASSAAPKTESASAEPAGEGGLDVLVADKVTGLGGMAILYLVHSAYTFAAILSLPPEEARVMFTHPLEMLARIGLIEPPNSNWALAGRFTSLPGGLYHDFGALGLVVGSIILGLLGMGAAYILRAFPTNVFAVGIVAGYYTVLFLSPIHFAVDFAAFPFICVSFIVVTVGAWLASLLSGPDAARPAAGVARA